MFNLFMVYKENVMITEDHQIIRDEKKNLENLGTSLDLLLENAGQEVILLRLTTSSVGLIYLESGR